MKVDSVNISEKKGVIKKPVSSVTLTQKGITADAHSGTWHRQVSMLSASSIEKFSKQAGRSIAPGEFAENLTISGFDLTEACLLDQFRIGNVLLELTQIGKKCHGDNCAIFKEVGNCVMPKEGVFCRVLEEGVIKPGDEIEYIPFTFSFKIITLSDRAYRGEYEDLSGPAIEETILKTFNTNNWRVDFSRVIIPDEAEQLKAEINASCRADSTVIITTGGTGIGPRDITPDTVKPMLEKELPGIMEFIRCKYGEKYPNALVSRSVAGVIGQTQIFTLPGSVKAATEYCDEILKTIEHSLFMLKSISLH
jgi:molybdenum cofactor synthesis domain-containing protein